ncbi:MAG: efflux system, outer rane lipoprotein NodT family, partial [Pedosphaera sp.]|nr:efflux system, outer rane lipoprotein NodT family [Pedosphaera sp.]
MKFASVSKLSNNTNHNPADLKKRNRSWGAKSSLIAIGVLILAGCAVGPNYKAPKTAVPAAFGNGAQTNMSAGEAAIAWWRGFDDPKLNQLVDLALTNNYDLRIATATLREARALHRQTQFDLLPAVNGVADYNRTLFSKDFQPGVSRKNRQIELYDAGFDATWELDLFGRVRRSVQATAAEVQVAEADRRGVQVSLISE